MEKPRRETLNGMCNQLAAHAWRPQEIDELVEPKLGIITGFGALLEQIEALRRIDLGSLPPAQSVHRPRKPGAP